MAKLALVSVLSFLVALSTILVVGGLSVVEAGPLGSAKAASAEFPFAITATAAIALVIVSVVIVLRHKHETKTHNSGSYSAQLLNYCDRCGNRLA